jgi:hypothetical protein
MENVYIESRDSYINMIKALFIDYTGTIVMEGGPEMKEAVMRRYGSCI